MKKIFISTQGLNEILSKGRRFDFMDLILLYDMNIREGDVVLLTEAVLRNGKLAEGNRTYETVINYILLDGEKFGLEKGKCIIQFD